MFSLGNKQCVDPAKLYAECVQRNMPTDLFAGKANRFEVRAGETPSFGAVLLTSEDFRSLNTATAFTLSVVDHLGHTLRFLNVYVTRAVRVVGGQDDDPEAVYLVDLADNRVRLRWVPISKAYNLDKSDGTGTQTATQNAGVDWTWAGVGADLWAAVGGLGTWPGFPSGVSPHGTPRNLNYYGGYALNALVQFLNRTGCELRFDNTTGTYAVVQIGGGGSDASYYQSWNVADRKFDGRSYTPDATNRPEKVRVRFVRLPAPTGGTDPYYTVDVALSTVAGVLTGSVVIVDDDNAAYGATGAPTNAATLATRAAQRAADWERRYTKANQTKVVQYLEYLPAARTAVGERRTAAVFEDVGDGFTTESYTVASPLYESLRFGLDATTAASGSDPDANTTTRGYTNFGPTMQTYGGPKSTTATHSSLPGGYWAWLVSTNGRADGLITDPAGFTVDMLGGLYLGNSNTQGIIGVGQQATLPAGTLPFPANAFDTPVLAAATFHPMLVGQDLRARACVVAGDPFTRILHYPHSSGGEYYNNGFAVYDPTGYTGVVGPGYRVGVTYIIRLDDWELWFHGGILWRIAWAGSPPAPPPPGPSPPPASPPPSSGQSTVAGVVTSGWPYYFPLVGREVVRDSGAATATTNAYGHYSFSSITAASHTFQITLGTGESAQHRLDSGAVTAGDTKTFTATADATHWLEFWVDPVITVTVTVANGSGAVAGRNVTVGGVTQATDATGTAVFYGVLVGTITAVCANPGGGETALWANTPGGAGKGYTSVFTALVAGDSQLVAFTLTP